MAANEDQYEEGPICYSCDGLVAPGATFCPCGVFLTEWADPFEGMTTEERFEAEAQIEQAERAGRAF